MADLVRQCEFGPRVPHTAASASCRAFLVETLRPLADVVHEQAFVHRFSNGDTLPLVNVIARFGPQRDQRLLLVAHYDSRPRAEYDPDSSRRDEPIAGANDGASGVAVLLEIARCLSRSRPPIGVDILLTDGEDWGQPGRIGDYLLGARHFASHRPPGMVDYRFGILLDLVGETDARFPREAYSQRFAPEMVDRIWAMARDRGIANFVDTLGREVFDDHIPLMAAGIPVVNIIDFEYRHWHTQGDTPDKCSARSLQAVGNLVVAVIYDY